MRGRKKLNQKRSRRISRVRAGIRGTALRPRLAVSRSNRYIYGQLIDDVKGITVVSVSAGRSLAPASRGVAQESAKRGQAMSAGEALAKKALEKGIKSAVFDRRAYKFHGRVKSFAEGARKGGLKI